MAEPPTYERVLTEASALNLEEQQRLVEALAGLMRRGSHGQSAHNIRELRGLGKHVWQGIDAQQYVDQERSAWDG
jgi:hypothetical protein